MISCLHSPEQEAHVGLLRLLIPAQPVSLFALSIGGLPRRQAGEAHPGAATAQRDCQPPEQVAGGRDAALCSTAGRFGPCFALPHEVGPSNKVSGGG